MNQNESITIVRRTTWVGLMSNIFLAAVKICAGVFGRSQVLIADGIHSISDLVTDLALLLGTMFWDRPPDEDHPHGHRRIETLITVAIGLLLAIVGLSMGIDAILHFKQPRVQHAGFLALSAASVSVVVKESLYRWTHRQAQKAHSPALEANAWHHRSDAFTSITAVIAVGTEMAHPQLAWVDRLGVLIVCIFILKAAWEIFHPALQQLVDAGAPPQIQEELAKMALQVHGVHSAHALRTRYLGPLLAVDLHIEVNGTLSVREGYEIAREVRQLLVSQGPGVADVIVQVEPRRDLREQDR